jgi:hypothetical protein
MTTCHYRCWGFEHYPAESPPLPIISGDWRYCQRYLNHFQPPPRWRHMLALSADDLTLVEWVKLDLESGE